MSIVSSRRTSPGRATAPEEAVAAVRVTLQNAESGVNLSEIIHLTECPQDDVADALAVAVDAGVVRFSVTPEGLSFFSAEHFELPAAAPNLVDDVMNFIAAHEDTERGSPDVVISPEDVIKGLHGTYPAAQILAAFDVLREEEMLWFRVNPITGRATVTLSRHRSFTIIGRDNDAGEALCFHVRAGNRAVAIRKVDESDYGGDDLTLFGITAGEIDFQPPKQRAMLVERL